MGYHCSDFIGDKYGIRPTPHYKLCPLYHDVISLFIVNSFKKQEYPMSEVANRVLKNSGYLYFSMGLSMFVSLYSTRLILNALGSSDFGIFCIIGGAIGMLGFLNAAMSTTTQRFINYAEGEGKLQKQKVFSLSV